MATFKMPLSGDVVPSINPWTAFQTPLTAEETAAIDALKQMLNQVAEVKQNHGRPAMRPRDANI